MSSNYPPGVTGNEDYFTGRIYGPCTIRVTLTVDVVIEDEETTGEEAVEKAILTAEERIKTNDPTVNVDAEFIN
jgi:hypothetical protein